MMVVMLVLCSSSILVAQTADSTITFISSTAAWAPALNALLNYAIPVLGSILVYIWNKEQSWLADKPDALKMGVYAVVVTALMYVGQLVHFAISPDTTSWTAPFWNGLASAIAGTLLVKVGILTEAPK